IFSCVVRRLRFSGPKTSIICSPMTSLKTSIKTITYLSDIGCLEIQGASLPAPNISTRVLTKKEECGEKYTVCSCS
ncbi:hypothetical protein, partial [Escherichia albertii]|uniref:hypothetical protein n=1 Tax=Escherichia albertii TaxID=208962 RepID=UPI00353124D9